ncbi:hypothetical protein GPECTOR_59g610 [Gonium pectorale]|uniref:Uncharacterized protein n=1 Tax=Gonium pectorale TaxID=33097 RepID=A0A150G5F4_GONPE|nr:hypothetical protein GPECTOR_59g610 [Gonium pectorale]|eukprot:KXZ45003.1 hypothetical protein GPECTOR_59g610 [Gonium pectorale]
MAVRDHSSQANFHELRVTHSAFELDVNFETRVIEGYVELTALAECDTPRELLLDTRSLSVHSVELLPPTGQTGQGPQPLEFRLGEPHKVLGSALRISIPAGSAPPVGGCLVISVRFTTSPASSATQWLAPAQTAGGTHPYLFTQCQAIHARSLVPCQDSPGAKMSYTAAVRVPQPLTALMSAVPDEPQPERGAHRAPYLLALAVGELSSRELGPRSRVWSEPGMVEAGAAEFADTAKYLEAGEAIAGEYVWGRYDLLLLPPSFPSLTNVVAHEIAHSWTGNLVTNASWEHFWLNEGFTVFLERKILGRLSGPAAFQFAASQGALKLAAEVERLGPTHPHTCLVPDLSGGVDPDDVFSSIP